MTFSSFGCVICDIAILKCQLDIAIDATSTDISTEACATKTVPACSSISAIYSVFAFLTHEPTRNSLHKAKTINPCRSVPALPPRQSTGAKATCTVSSLGLIFGSYAIG